MHLCGCVYDHHVKIYKKNLIFQIVKFILKDKCVFLKFVLLLWTQRCVCCSECVFDLCCKSVMWCMWGAWPQAVGAARSGYWRSHRSKRFWFLLLLLLCWRSIDAFMFIYLFDSEPGKQCSNKASISDSELPHDFLLISLTHAFIVC